MSVDRKALTREYKQKPRPAGVFSVRNTASGRTLVGATADLPGMLNRQRFQLEMGSHADKELQADWNALGEAAFRFEVLDELTLPDDPAFDPTDDLKALHALWAEKLTAEGTGLYRDSRRGL